jgi:hypothetical protein
MNRLIASLTLAILTGTLVGCAVPRGTIVAYNGDATRVPGGWSVCDAKHHQENSSVPDLSGKFLKGTQGSETPGQSGGSATHVHDGVNQFTSQHTLNWNGDGFTGAGPGHSNTIGSTGPASNIPPYYAVVYIIKL